MTISILVALIVIETLIILLVFLAYFIKKNSKLKKTIADLLIKLSENLFSKLVTEEIEKTIEHINETSHTEDELELADKETEPSDEELKRILTFRSSYLHAEINAYDASAGNPDLFWHHLAENIALLIPKAPPEDEAVDSNELIDEIMQELQIKLDKSIESNISLQALLDSLLTSGSLATDQIQTIKNSQANFHALSQDVSDLENKLKNSLNIEIIGTSSKAKTNTSGNTLIIEKASNVVNKEVNKLKDVIYEQGNKINALLKSLKDDNQNIDPGSVLHKHLTDLESSQKETSMCIEVLEMENQRLMEEIENLQNSPSVLPIDGLDTEDMSSDQLKLKIHELEQIIEEKEKEYNKLSSELSSVESEFMAVYEKGSNKDQ